MRTFDGTTARSEKETIGSSMCFGSTCSRPGTRAPGPWKTVPYCSPSRTILPTVRKGQKKAGGARRPHGFERSNGRSGLLFLHADLGVDARGDLLQHVQAL